MSARRRRKVCITKEVDVDITIEDFETEDLLDELLARGTISDMQHKALSMEREIPSLISFDPDEMERALFSFDPDEMERALWRLSLRDADGALYHLENAIPAARGLAALLGKH